MNIYSSFIINDDISFARNYLIKINSFLDLDLKEMSISDYKKISGCFKITCRTTLKGSFKKKLVEILHRFSFFEECINLVSFNLYESSGENRVEGILDFKENECYLTDFINLKWIHFSIYE